MGVNVIVLGSTGSGKSRSVINLDPDKTVIINVLNKPLPFRKSSEKFSEEKGNLLYLEDWRYITEVIDSISKEGGDINCIVIDDARYIMEKELFDRVNETGYNKFTTLAQHFQAIVKATERTRNDLAVVFMMHDDDVYDDKKMVGKKCKLSGKMIEEHYNPMEVVPICLYCQCTFDKSGNAVHEFVTRQSRINGVVIPAKTPEDMFGTAAIPNDLNLVLEAIKEYY